MKRCYFPIGQMLFAIIAVLLSSTTSSYSQEPFRAVVDTTLKGDPETVPGPNQQIRQVGVIMDSLGRIDQFAEKEIIFKPENDQVLKELLGRWHGRVISDGSIPEPPEKYKYLQRDIPKSSGYFLIEVDSRQADLKTLPDIAKKFKLYGTFTFSSQEILRLFAVVLHEWNIGNKSADLNHVFKLNDCYTTSTQEYAMDASAPNPALPNEGYMDAFMQPCFNDPYINVTEAWELLSLFHLSRYSVPACLIDVGFILNDDFPARLQYDFVDEDRDVDAYERNYHGTRTLSIACARHNDRFGSAGTGGMISLPMPFRFNLTFSQGARAIRTAVSWGAKVINNSWGGYCNWWCEHFPRTSGLQALNDAIDEAYDHGVVVVVAGGNDEQDIGPELLDIPSEAGSGENRVIVVAAIDYSTKKAVRREDGFRWGSNYGQPVDIWSPAEPGLITTPTPADPTISSISGTSGAAAYTSGVVAMMRAVCPSLTVDEIADIIRSTAWGDSPDSRVQPGYLNAFDALYQVAEHERAHLLPPDSLESNDFSHYARLQPGLHCLTLSTEDPEDGYYFYLDDYRNVDININCPLLGCTEAVMHGTGFTPSQRIDPRFSQELPPGTYYLESRLPSSTRNVFYEIEFSSDEPATIEPDRFEDNNTLATAASIMIPEHSIGEIFPVEDLNFHVPDDQDFYALSIPDLPNATYTDRIAIYVEPEERGRGSDFLLTAYGASGETIATGAHAMTVENVHNALSTSRFKFSVSGRNRRNFYRIEIGYDQYTIPATLPESYAFYDIPDWMQAESEFYLLQPPLSVLEGIPLDLPFPSNPKVIESFLAEKPYQIIPAEIMVIKWPEMQDFQMDLSFYGSSQEMGFSLIDNKGNVISKARDVNPGLQKSAQTSEMATKTIKVDTLRRGMYGVVVNGIRFPMLYTVKMPKSTDVANETPQATAPVEFRLEQNYPNPFNPTTTIRYQLAKAANISLMVYDVRGKQVAEIVHGAKEAGIHKITFSVKGLPSGIYFYRLTTEQGFSQTRKLTILK